MIKKIKELVFFLQMFVGTRPYLYMFLYKVFGKNKKLLVGKETEIVIEGFPRSGNTFSVVALEYAEGRVMKIAHHLHAPAQIIWGIKYGVPAVVLIRNPVDVISSLVIREDYISIKVALIAYILFYGSLLKFKPKYLILKFEDVIGDYGEGIKKINNFFKKEYKLFVHSDENVSRVFSLVQKYAIEESDSNKLDEKKVSRPSDDRKAQSEELKKEIKGDVYSVLLIKANNIYNEFVIASDE